VANVEASTGAGPRLPLYKVIAVGAGNALEFYDFLTFSFFSVQISHTFFPAQQTTHGLLYALATFGIGFTTRPLGGWFLGRYGDRAGRKAAMMLTFVLMGSAIVGVALTPSYAQIGMAAPILLVVFRMLQGFALGGEVGPTTAYLVEVAPPQRRGLYVSVQYATQDVAILIAGVVGFALSSLLTEQALDDWGWRMAFLAGAAIVPIGLWMRRALPETFDASHAAQATPGEGDPQRRISLHRLLCLGFILLGSSTTLNYILIYLTTYAQDSLHWSVNIAFVVTIVVGLAQATGDVLAGQLADRVGRRPIVLACYPAIAILAVPMFLVLNQSPAFAFVVMAVAVLSVLVALGTGPILITLTELLPRAIRSGTLATLYALAIASFGGTTQYISKWLGDLTGSPYAPAWYATFAAVAGGLAMLYMPESAPHLRKQIPGSAK
jgi:MFS family permease